MTPESSTSIDWPSFGSPVDADVLLVVVCVGVFGVLLAVVLVEPLIAKLHNSLMIVFDLIGSYNKEG